MPRQQSRPVEAPVDLAGQGQVELQVSIQPGVTDSGLTVLCLRVCDSGIGIAADQHERIFQAFQQLDGSTSRRYGGTGLGLAITRQLLEALGGDIQLQSQPGQGSQFSVRLPVEVLSEQQVRALQGHVEPLLALPAERRSAPLKGQHVLLVDDDVRNIYALMALLDELGLRVTPAADGVEAAQVALNSQGFEWREPASVTSPEAAVEVCPTRQAPQQGDSHATRPVPGRTPTP